MKKQLICIRCPVGCRMEAEVQDGKVVSVSGNSCPLGEAYAHDECVNPTRIVTTIARVNGRDMPLSVKTAQPVPKALMRDCVRAVQALQLEPPIRLGDVVLEDVCGTGVPIVATANAE